MKLDESAAAYQQALQMDPKSVDALSNLASVLKDSGNVPEAIARLSPRRRT